MAAGAYCFLSGCTVFCTEFPQQGGAQWVAGPQPGTQYGIVQFVSQFPGSGWTVPGYCLPPPSSGGYTPPPAPPAPVPPPAPSPTQPPVEIPPPPPPAGGVYTGPEDDPPHDTQPPGTTVPPSECDPPMETAPPSQQVPPANPKPPTITGPGAYGIGNGGADKYGQYGLGIGGKGSSSSSAQTKHGFSAAELLNSAHTGSMSAVPIYTSLLPIHHEDPNKSSPINYKRQPKVVLNENGGISIYKAGSSEGYLIFHSPDLEPYHLFGSTDTNRLPSTIAATSFLLHSGEREDGSLGDSPNQKLAFGLPHKTSQYPKMGFVFERTSGPVLKLHGTDVNGALDISCNPVFAIRTGLNVLCGATFQSNVTVDGNLTVIGNIINSNLDTWTDLTFTTSDSSPYSVALSDSFSPSGTYKLFLNITTYGDTPFSYTHDEVYTYRTTSGTMVAVGVNSQDIVDEFGGVSLTHTTNGIGTVTLQANPPEACVKWFVKYRVEFIDPGDCLPPVP